jgi:hypothetical protein
LWVAADQEGGQVQSLQGPGFERLPSALEQGAMPPADLAALADRLAANCARLAGGLGDYARDLDEVHRLMGESVAAASPYLRTTHEAVFSPVRPPDPADAELTAAWAAWHAAIDWWRRARALEDSAVQAWGQCLQRAAPDGPVDFEGDDAVRPPLPPEAELS